MTDHSIEELERQYNNAKSRANRARLDERAAAKRLHDARCRESGWLGKTVIDHKGKSIRVHDVEFWLGKPYAVKGFRFKKDGTVGFAEGRVYIDEVSQ